MHMPCTQARLRHGPVTDPVPQASAGGLTQRATELWLSSFLPVAVHCTFSLRGSPNREA